MKKILLITIALMMMMSITVFAEGESGSIVSSGHGSTYVIKNDGSVWGWGMSYAGNGNGHKEKQVTPVKILNNARSVSANLFGGVAVKKDDTLWAWGRLNDYPIANGSSNPTFLTPTKILADVKLAAMGRDYIAVIKNDNSLWICGNMYIGDGTNAMADTSDSFVKVMSHVKDMYAGSDTIYVIKDDDTLWGWGENSDAELGNMDIEDVLTPIKILDDVNLVRQNGSTVLAIRLDGSLYSWGQGTNDGIYTEHGWVEYAGSPYKVMDHVLTATMCKSGSGVLVVKTDGTLWGWNNQWYDEGKRMEPYKYADHVAAVSNGERHAAVVKKDGTLWTMGGNYRYGLGYESDEVWYTPLTKVLDNVQDAPASWAMEEVERAIGEQLIPEDMQNNYTKAITREEFCILAIRMIEVKSGMTIDEYLTVRGLTIAPINTFIDTTNKDILVAKTLGITDGTSATTFSPNNMLTREQAAKFLSTTAKACGRKITAEIPSYADVDKIANWAKPYTGYVYDINVMKGVGGNKFDPRGSYQRQQAFMTMYRIWKSIDEVSMEKVETIAEKPEMPANNIGDSLLDIKSDLPRKSYPNDFTMHIEGTSTNSEVDIALKYDVYYKDANVRIDTYWDNKIISKCIYNSIDDTTYTEYMFGTHYAEVINGNMLPIRLLNIEYLEQLEIDNEDELFTAHYEILDGEKVLYIKTSIKNGVITEMWYSLKFLTPIKFREMDIEDDGEISKINWSVQEIDESPMDVGIFDIPSDAEVNAGSVDDYIDTPITGSTRTLLLYEVKSIKNDEKGIDGMMNQVLYYSEASYETLVDYFKNLLKGTDDYDIYVQDGRTSIDGTINGELVIVIVNDYMTTKPEVGMNGVNVNYYK